MRRQQRNAKYRNKPTHSEQLLSLCAPLRAPSLCVEVWWWLWVSLRCQFRAICHIRCVTTSCSPAMSLDPYHYIGGAGARMVVRHCGRSDFAPGIPTAWRTTYRIEIGEDGVNEKCRRCVCAPPMGRSAGTTARQSGKVHGRLGRPADEIESAATETSTLKLDAFAIRKWPRNSVGKCQRGYILRRTIVPRRLLYNNESRLGVPYSTRTVAIGGPFC